MDRWVIAARLIGIGWYVGLCVVGGIVGGIWLDNKLGTTVIFTLVGLVFGLVLAAYGTYKMVSPLVKDAELEDKDSRRNGG